MKENLLCTHGAKSFQQAKCFLAEIIMLMKGNVKAWLCHCEQSEAIQKRCGFSLVEMLMALLVASLLLAALAPVMTRKMNENIHVSGEFSVGDKKVKTYEISYNDCLALPGAEEKTAPDGSKYCEGEWVVPNNYNGPMTVTLISAGGGGGTAPTAGYTEYTTAGSTNTFTVPAMVNQIEATLISGGAGGGAGGQTQTNVDYLTAGEYTWNVPEIARNKNILVTACGGGGGGGGFGNIWSFHISTTNAGDGGGGGYIVKAASLNNSSTQNIIIGSGGGGGGAAGGTTTGLTGYTGGGGGGADPGGVRTGYGGKGGSNSGIGAAAKSTGGRGSIGDGGERGDISSSCANTDGQNGVLGQDSLGGTGGGAGDGGISRWLVFLSSTTGQSFVQSQGGGGGGGSMSGYGGGGGGGGSGGSGGGGGGAATIFGTRNNQLVMAPGGGGGGGSALDDIIYDANGKNTERIPISEYEQGLDRPRTHGSGGGGGGGGGAGGGIGGNGGRAQVNHATKGGNGKGYQASTIFGENHCNGGIAYHGYNVPTINYSQRGETGKPGAMRITYLNYGAGGGGGGSGTIIGLNRQNVAEKENLTIIVGSGANGGTPSKINQNGSIIAATNGVNSRMSFLKRKDDVLQQTGMNTDTTCSWSGCGGDAGGECNGTWCSSGHVVTYWTLSQRGDNTENFTKSIATNSKLPGFSVTGDNKSTDGKGADGGAVTTPWFECTPGKGGTKENPVGGNAQGFGCGGGGGYGLHDGGKGSGGYARLSWNLYWDAALNSGKGAYKRAETGSGGGGASGNIMKFSVNAISGQPISIRIGKGGAGAYVASNTVVPAIKGGDTVFGTNATGEIKVAGGNGGNSPTVSGNTPNTILINGTGGTVPDKNICKYSGSDYTKKTAYCTKGGEGKNPAGSNGGKGGNLVGYGEGGAGGVQDTGNNSLGTPGSGIGSGGGGAAIRELSGAINTADILNNPNKGGDGASGKIIIQVLE